MIVNFKCDYKDCFGNQIMDETAKSETPKQIWRHLALQLFNLSTLGDAPLPAEMKYKAYSLSLRIAASPETVEITTEEGSFLKDVCAVILSSGAYGQVEDIIEGRGVFNPIKK